MKKLTLLLLLMVSPNVFAEWTRVISSKDGKNTFYINFETIKRKDNKVKMWELVDFKTVEQGSLSSLNRNEYDCEEETTRTLDLYYYSGNMKNGEIVISQSNIKEEPSSIRPDTIESVFYKIACNKK